MNAFSFLFLFWWVFSLLFVIVELKKQFKKPPSDTDHVAHYWNFREVINIPPISRFTYRPYLQPQDANFQSKLFKYPAFLGCEESWRPDQDHHLTGPSRSLPAHGPIFLLRTIKSKIEQESVVLSHPGMTWQLGACS